MLSTEPAMAPSKRALLTLDGWRRDRFVSRPFGMVLAAGSVCAFGIVFLFQLLAGSSPFATHLPLSTDRAAAHRLRLHFTPDESVPVQPCRGPRAALYGEPIEADYGKSLTSLPGLEFPQTTTGSYEAIGLEKSWMTFEQRYGPYGHGEDEEKYNFTKVDWSRVDWGGLIDSCAAANHARFNLQHGAYPQLSEPRFRLAGQTAALLPPKKQTGRQAVVLRTWSTFEYTSEDIWNIRALIAEAALATGGTFSVVLLVDVKQDDCDNIHADDRLYRKILEESVPEEFRSIAVLFHHSLQKSWYPKVSEYRAFWQVMQPLQLFGHFFPEFDHFWQFEMDTRFTGHIGHMLQKFHEFSKKEPYKQSAERASWRYIPRLHGSYADFSNNIDKALKGGAKTWGPIEVDGIHPIGAAPPMAPMNDAFEWGVGSDADLLVFSSMNDVTRIAEWEDWIFKDYYFNTAVPRYMSVPAQARASYDLLEAIHQTQHTTDFRTPSEGTLPSYAMWHGLKVVQLPIPNYMFPERNIRELNWILNGGSPGDFEGDGTARGASFTNAHLVTFFMRPFTWDWTSNLADPVYEWWMGRKVSPPEPGAPLAHIDYPVVPPELPSFMAEVDGQVYAPNILLHPRKTNFLIPE